jgi:myo-inositol-1(or 4)-monophosphatase
MIEDIIKIAKEAGEIVRNGFGKNLEIEFKTNESNLVTQIDKKSEAFITDFIQKKFPGHGVLGEEGASIKATSDYTWVVDPLDGTTNFAHGVPIFSVSIGVQKNGENVAGVIYDVMRDEAYSAELGGGAFCNNKKISVSQNEMMQRSLLVTGFPYDIADNPNNALDIFVQLVKVARGMRRLGSAALDMCYVAKGVFDGFWEVHLHPWDICAGMLIIKEAGGRTTDFKGAKMDIFNRQILSTNGKIHNQMLDIIDKCTTKK